MENLNNVTEVAEKAVETLEPVAKEVAKVGHETLKKAGLYVAGIITGIGGTKIIEKIVYKKEVKTDKKHWWQKKDKDIVLSAEVNEEEVQAEQPEE